MEGAERGVGEWSSDQTPAARNIINTNYGASGKRLEARRGEEELD